MKTAPTNWTLARIGDLIDFAPKNAVSDETEAGFVPLQRLGVDYRSRHTFEIKSWGEIRNGYTHFSNGDVLLARITPSFENGKAGIVRDLPNGIGAGSTEFFVCRPIKEVLLPEYLLAYFKTQQFITNGKQLMSGAVGQQRVPKKYLLNCEIPLAPLEEQRQIIAKIDDVVKRVDFCRERLKRISNLIDSFRQSTLKAALSGKLTEEWRGGDTSNWTYERAADVCEKVQSGGTPKEGFSDRAGIPFLKVYNIVNQFINFDYKPQYVPVVVHEGELKKSQALPGDVLMNIVGPPLGKVAIVPNSHSAWNINQALTIFRPSQRVTSKWLYYMLCSGENVRAVLPNTRGMAGQINISLSQCRDFTFPIPPLAEQQEITRRIDSLFAYAEGIEIRTNSARIKAENLTPSLFDKAFRGQLVPPANDLEPAGEVLKRVIANRAAQQELPNQAKLLKTKKAKMNKPTIQSVKGVISNIPAEEFTFEELSGHIFPDNSSIKDYESLKEILFSILSEAKPIIKQAFDNKKKRLNLSKV